jgi:hypothetical protein
MFPISNDQKTKPCSRFLTGIVFALIQSRQVDSSKFCENDRTNTYNLKSMALNKKREDSFVVVLLFNIVAKFGSHWIKRARAISIFVGTI